MDNNQHFSDADRQGLYRAIHERRDVRSQFLPDPIPDEVLARLLKAAHHAPLEMDLFSTCLAVQNLWLAARAEGIGVGWVSILDQDDLSAALNLPESVYPLAYLCVGYVSEFLEQPELEAKGWRSRLPLDELVHRNGWGEPLADSPLADLLKA